tara:strand:+ start:56 stop:187 length:132 start_codon:yes stop_codon:yes gene_type:complete
MFKLGMFMNLKKGLLRIYLVLGTVGHYFSHHFISMGQQKMKDY